MSPLREALTNYLTIRRALGYKLVRAGKLLAQFVTYLEGAGAKTVTIEHALGWARLPAGGNGYWWAYRLSVVRCFATYLHTLDPSAEVPQPDLLPVRKQRATPYLYSEKEIDLLIEACSGLQPVFRVTTYRTLLGLLAITGLRVGEALRLDREDIDFDQGLLLVREGKFGKSRQLPLHATTLRALRSYLRERDHLSPSPSTSALFISTAGKRLPYGSVQWTFRKLVHRVGIKPRSTACHPRLHDLRHTFAVNTVIDAYRSGSDVQARLPLLSTRRGKSLSRDAVERRIAKYAERASRTCTTLRTKKVTPHVLRHTAAMRLLHAGVDTSVIALWLGHENVDTTQIYLHADLALKEKAIARTRPLNGKPGRYRPSDTLLAFLEGL